MGFPARTIRLMAAGALRVCRGSPPSASGWAAQQRPQRGGVITPLTSPRQTDRRAHARAHALLHPAPSSPRPPGMRARGDCGPRPAVRGQRARRRLGLGGSLFLAGPTRGQPVSLGLPGSYLAGAAAAPGPGRASLAGSARGRRYRAKLRGARPVRPHEPPGTSGRGRRWSRGGEWAGPGRGLTPPPHCEPSAGLGTLRTLGLPGRCARLGKHLRGVCRWLVAGWGLEERSSGAT